MSRNPRGEANLSKKVKQGPVEVDFEDSALVVHYETEVVELDERGGVIGVVERKPEIRRIKIKSLSPDKNMAQLAADIVDKCKYIHPSRIEEIEQLLIKLRKHHMANAAKAAATPTPQQQAPSRYDDEDSYEKPRSESRGRTNQGKREQPSNTRDRDHDDRNDRGDRYNMDRERGDRGGDRDRGDRDRGDRDRGDRGDRGDKVDRNNPKKEKKPPVDNLPPADMNELDEYLELLYQVSGKSDKEKEEGLRAQERGTAMILKLCRDVMNLEQLIQNSTVMGAITRVLQEEYKKSIDLTFNILRIFLAFSNFMEMHNLMANYKIGVLTMKAIEFEVKRIEIRDAERQQREANYQDEVKALKQEISDPRELSAQLDKLRKSKEKEIAKQVIFDRKQDKVLFVGFYILLNLAEDVSVEKKMVKKGLIALLVAILNHRLFEDLLILVMTFLKKLSVFEENKDVIREQQLIVKLLPYLSCSSSPLINITLRLLFNLSFDQEIRQQMMSSGYIPKLIALLKTPSYRAKTLKLLYHLSVDDRCKAMIHYTDGIHTLMGMVINFPQDTLAKELAALMVNLSYSAKNIEQMISNKGLNLLVDRFVEKRDVFVMKVIRNISLYTFMFQQQHHEEGVEFQYKYRGLWSPHIKPLLEVMMEENSHDIVIEIVGVLANMTIYDLPSTLNWSKLLRDYQLLTFINKMLIPGIAQNDLILEIILLVSTIATDPAACNILATGNLIVTVYQIFKDKGEDVEITLQCLNCFHKLMFTQSSLEALMYSTRIFSDIIECLTHRSTVIRSKAEVMSDIVLEYDRKNTGEMGQLGKQVLKKRFESYNKVWLANVVESGNNGYGGGDGGYYDNMGEYEQDNSRFLSAQDQEIDMLNSAKYFNEKMDNSMMDWNMNSKMDDSLDYGPRYMQSEIDSWNGGGGGYK